MHLLRSTTLPVLLAAALLALTVPLLVAPPAQAAGTVTVTVTGRGTVHGDGIACTEAGAPDCSEHYADTTETVCDPELKPPCHTYTVPPGASFTAAPDAGGYAFTGWTGCDQVEGRVCDLVVTGPATITADYRDVQAPAVPAVATPEASRGTATVTASTQDNSGRVAGVDFFRGGVPIGSDTTAPFAVAVDTTTLTDGPHEIRAVAHDVAGNRSQPGAGTLRVDNTAPTLTITSGPDGDVVAEGSTQSWGFTVVDTGSGALAPECSLVPAGALPEWGACARPDGHDATGPAEGAHTFTVRARDGAGNVATVERSFAVDGTPPRTRIVDGPPATVRTRGAASTARFRFASDDPAATYQCRLDAGRRRACDERERLRVGLGRHVLRVWATDEVGNADATPAVHRWRVVRRR